MESASRRMSRIGGHLIPISNLDAGSVKFNSTSSSSNSTLDRNQRIHGQVSALPVSWRIVRHESGNDFTDIIYEKAVGEGIAKITINRPERRNVFRPRTIKEIKWAFNEAREDTTIGVIILVGQGTKAFCSGGDQTATYEDGPLDLVELQGITPPLWAAEDYIKKMTKAAKKKGGGSGAEKYVQKYREDSAKCVEEVERSVRESAGEFLVGKKRKLMERMKAKADKEKLDAKKLKRN